MTIVLLLALWAAINVAVVIALVRSRSTGRVRRPSGGQARSFSAT